MKHGKVHATTHVVIQNFNCLLEGNHRIVHQDPTFGICHSPWHVRSDHSSTANTTINKMTSQPWQGCQQKWLLSTYIWISNEQELRVTDLYRSWPLNQSSPKLAKQVCGRKGDLVEQPKYTFLGGLCKTAKTLLVCTSFRLNIFVL